MFIADLIAGVDIKVTLGC